MRRWLEWLETRKFGLPSVFDLAAISFIVILPIAHTFAPGLNQTMARSLFLVYGTVVLMCLGLAAKQRRQYSSVILALLVLWNMRNLFRFNFLEVLNREGSEAIRLAMGEVAQGWANWSLMNEGFMFILFGAMLIAVLTRYGKSYRWYYVALVFSLARVYDHVFGWNGWSMTPILATCLAAAITLTRVRKVRWMGIGALLTGAAVVVYKWDWIWNIKWISRPGFWLATLKRVKLFGRGFYHTVNTWGGFVAPEHVEFHKVLNRWGRGWRQNDLLEYAETAGIVGALLVVAFFARLLIRGRVSVAYFLVLAFALKCFFQRTMFFPEEAGMVLVAIALLELESKEET